MGEEGEIKIWWGGEFIWRVIFVGGGGRGREWANFWLLATPQSPPVGKTLNPVLRPNLAHPSNHTSFLSSLTTSSSLTGQVLLQYSIILCTYAEYNLSFAYKSKPLLVNKVTESLSLLHSLLILVITLPGASLPTIMSLK